MLVAEGRPDGAGFKAAAALSKVGVPVTVVLDSAVGYHMEVADLCVTGAEGVLENGGIVNKVGASSCVVVVEEVVGACTEGVPVSTG